MPGLLETGLATASYYALNQTETSHNIEQALIPLFPESPFIRNVIANFGIPIAVGTITLVSRQAMRRLKNHELINLHGSSEDSKFDEPQEKADAALNRTRSTAVLRERAEPNPDTKLKGEYVRPKQSQRFLGKIFSRKRENK